VGLSLKGCYLLMALILVLSFGVFGVLAFMVVIVVC